MYAPHSTSTIADHADGVDPQYPLSEAHPLVACEGAADPLRRFGDVGPRLGPITAQVKG